MTYNTSFMNNTGNILTYYTGVNSASNDMLSIVLLIVVWVIVFIALKHFDTKVVFLASSFVTTTLGLIFFSLDLVSFAVFVVPLVMTFFSLMAFMFSKD